MILLIDNYDSFVYNLARYVSELGLKAEVRRNDSLTLSEIERLNPSHLIISPGPCTPLEAGISMEAIRHFAPSLPILGVCLGHQAIGQVYGGLVTRAKRPMHGKVSLIRHTENDLFIGLQNPMTVARYHSLIVSEENFPVELKVTARCEQGEVMALRHRTYPLFGLQFHPESILTPCGYALLENFLFRWREAGTDNG
jgi:anthranilate synthase/aminodeoxychorismate synthase-like glutamine amidotransferase